jgi:hypothetical protein
MPGHRLERLGGTAALTSARTPTPSSRWIRTNAPASSPASSGWASGASYHSRSRRRCAVTRAIDPSAAVGLASHCRRLSVTPAAT